MIFKKIVLFLFLLLLSANICNAEEKLTLADCIELGIENNFDIKKANYDFLSSKEATKQVRSQYEPSVNTQVGRTDVKSPQTLH